MKVWRSGHQYLAECEECGSRGSVHLQTALERSPEAAAELSAWARRIGDRRQRHQHDLAAVIQAVQQGTISAKDGDAEIQGHSAAFGSDMADLVEAKPKDDAVERVAACPWCQRASSVTVTVLSDDQREPPEWLPKKGA